MAPPVYHPPGPFLENDAQQFVRNSLKAEMAKRGMSFRDLASALERIGVEEDERNLRNKVARGTFSAAFYLQCLRSMGASRVDTGIEVFQVDLETGRWRDAENWEG